MKVNLNWTSSMTAALLIAVLVSGLGCHRNTQSGGPPGFIRAFSDYEFVGMGPGGYDPAAIAAHGLIRQPLPPQFFAGHQYIFHRRSTTEDVEVFTEIQERLKSRGVEITQAGCCLDHMIGGPGFNIRFKDGDYRGVIFNPFDGRILDDRELAARVDVDDYIVVVEEGPPTR